MRLTLFLMHLFLLFLLQLFAWAAVWVTRNVENSRDDSSEDASDSRYQIAKTQVAEEPELGILYGSELRKSMMKATVVQIMKKGSSNV